MSHTDPLPLTNKEWKEVMAVPAVRDAWGLEVDTSVSEFSDRVYAAHFNFRSGGPGYSGDLYLLQGDALTDAGPMVLRRDEQGVLHQ